MGSGIKWDLPLWHRRQVPGRMDGCLVGKERERAPEPIPCLTIAERDSLGLSNQWLDVLSDSKTPR